MAAPTERSLSSLIAANDLDEILREIDAICARRDWGALVEVRERCDRALERGFQLWPASHHAAYRLALEAPGEWAATVLEEGTARFAPGPLPEVAAQWHDWADLAPWVPPGPAAVLALHERVVRGEDLSAVDVLARSSNVGTQRVADALGYAHSMGVIHRDTDLSDWTPNRSYTGGPGSLIPSRFGQRVENEASLLGVSTTLTGMGTGAPYRVIDPAHWCFEGTGLKKGDLFGEEWLDARNPGGASGHGHPICYQRQHA